MTHPRYVIIGGGSFQGKSLAALHIAHRLSIPTIICTDIIRNVLKSAHPGKPWFGTSTYLLSTDDLQIQMTEVSTVLIDVLEILVSRGESAIIEGMHITDDCLRTIAGRPRTLALCVNCQLPFEGRIEAKSQTRKRLFDDRYLAHRDRITGIHDRIVSMYEGIGAPIIGYRDIHELYDSLDRLIGG